MEESQSIRINKYLSEVGYCSRRAADKLIEEGKVTIDIINDACKRVLDAKYDLGLFEDPYRYSDEKREKETIYKPEFLEAALAVANNSLVLLKNNNALLPLNKNPEIIE